MKEIGESIARNLTPFVSIWPVIVPLSLGLALAFHAGYFCLPFGLNFFLVSVEDLSKTGLILFAGLGALYSFVPIFNATKLVETKFTKILVTVLCIAALISYDVYHIIISNLEENQYKLVHTNLSLVVKVLAAAVLLSGYYAIGRQSLMPTIEVAAFTYLMLVLLCFFLGMQNLYVDSQNLRIMRLVFDKEEAIEGVYLNERTYFYLILQPADCSFTSINKSSVRMATVRPTPDNPMQRRQIEKCMLFGPS